MFTIKQPPTIIFGYHSVQEYNLPHDSIIISSKGAKSRGWLEYIKLHDAYLFDNVEPNPSIEIVEEILQEFSSTNFSNVIGIGGGSSLDVAKFVGFKMKKRKIMIPTTFGSGSEVTRISVLKVNGKKQSFHDDSLLADVAIVDSYFINDSPEDV
ncbi:MAG: iron-containing alcohol dehydrogenase, partial [Nitrososphaerota archaeon]